MEGKFSYFAVGIFILLTFSLGVFIFIDRSSKNINANNTEEYGLVVYSNIKGVSKGSLVTFNGIEAGYVSEVRLDEVDRTAVFIGVALDRRFPINRSTRANLATTGFTGKIFINLTTADIDARKIEIATGRKTPLIIAQQRDLPYVVEKITDLLEEANNAVKLLNNVIDLNKNHVDSTFTNVNLVLTKMQVALDSIANTALALSDVAGGISKNSGNIADSIESVLVDFNFLLQDTRKAVNNISRITSLIERNPSGFILKGNSGVLQLPEYELVE